MNDPTRILSAIEQGDPQAADQLLPLVYDELRKLAAQRLAHEKPGQTLQATALVHEAYLRLVGESSSSSWENARHFFAAAAEAMRRILIERARRKRPAGTAAIACGSTCSRSISPARRRTTICWRSMRPCPGWRRPSRPPPSA
jgi:RNA polymerase sigma factor (TIGR02999 family)